jgi:hypothetical protein
MALVSQEKNENPFEAPDLRDGRNDFGYFWHPISFKIISSLKQGRKL